jgi:hypothetical protein
MPDAEILSSWESRCACTPRGSGPFEWSRLRLVAWASGPLGLPRARDDLRSGLYADKGMDALIRGHPLRLGNTAHGDAGATQNPQAGN